jgi:zinc/manganese transport system substrate-binding protein
MKAIFAFALAVVLALCATPPQAAAQAPQAPLHVVTTTTDIKDLVITIGGGKVDVQSLAAPSQDPHALELKPVQLALLRGADLVIRIGLDHEPWLARMQTQAPVLDLSRNVRLLQTDTPRLRVERRAHIHLFGNPHYWLDPENARNMAVSITGMLTKLRPGDRAYFEGNRAAFNAQLDARIPGWTTSMAPYAGTKVVVLHDSWTYFFDYFHLSIVASAEPNPGIPPSPAELARLFSRMRDSKVRLIVANPDSNPALAGQLAEHTSARPVVLVPSVGGDPAAKTYLSLIDLNVSRLAKALQ